MCVFSMDDDDEEEMVVEKEDGEERKMSKMENSFGRRIFDCPDLFFCQRQILQK